MPWRYRSPKPPNDNVVWWAIGFVIGALLVAIIFHGYWVNR
jgi:hypothetical protein